MLFAFEFCPSRKTTVEIIDKLHGSPAVGFSSFRGVNNFNLVADFMRAQVSFLCLMQPEFAQSSSNLRNKRKTLREFGENSVNTGHLRPPNSTHEKSIGEMKLGYGLDFLSQEVLPKKVSTFKPNPTLKRIHGDGNKNQRSRFQGRTSINVYSRKFQKIPLLYFHYTYCIFFKSDIADRGQILGV